MIHAARQRLSNYRLNSGNGVMVWNLLMLAFLGYITWNLRSPVAQAVMGGTIVLSAVLGYAIVPLARWRFQIAVKVMNTARWVGIIIIALNFFNLVPVPLLAVLAGLALLIWSLSASFWLITEPGVLTSRGQEELIRRYGEPELPHAHAAEAPHDDDFEDQPPHDSAPHTDRFGSRQS
jgi:hypothetical protein